MIKGLKLRPFINQHKGSQLETPYENKSVFGQKSLYMSMLPKIKADSIIVDFSFLPRYIVTVVHKR